MNAVSVIIPAYNEAERIEEVVQAAISANFDEVIVVDDGSSDDTGDLAERLGARVLRLYPNRHKGGALKAGVEAAKNDVLLFLDADLHGFNHDNLHMLADPVSNGRYDQVIGVTQEATRFTAGQNGKPETWQGALILSGQRAIKREFLNKLPDEAWDGYGIEIWLNDVVQRHGGKSAVFRFPDVTAAMKWEKDPERGTAKMADMLAEVFHTIQRVIAYYQAKKANEAMEYQEAPVAQTLQAKCSSTECVADVVASSMKKALWTEDVQDKFSQRLSAEFTKPMWLGAGAASAFFFGPLGALAAGFAWATSSVEASHRPRPERNAYALDTILASVAGIIARRRPQR